MFMPKFRWGNVVPTQQGNRVRRGPGYQFYKIVPNDIMEFATGKGVEEPLEAGDVALAKANYREAAGQLAGEKVDAIIIGGMPVSANFGRPEILSLIDETQKKFGIRTSSPAEAFLAAMKHLGLKSV